MTRPAPVLFAFPGQARVGRPVPKTKIYEHGQIGSALRDKFVAQIEQITWAYKLAPETLNLSARPEVPEIQVFDIELKGAELDVEVLRAIDRAIPLPIIFSCTETSRRAWLLLSSDPARPRRASGYSITISLVPGWRIQLNDSLCPWRWIYKGFTNSCYAACYRKPLESAKACLSSWSV